MASNSPIEVDKESGIILSSTQTLEFDDVTLRAIAEVYMVEGNKCHREKEFNNAIHFYTEGIKVNCKDEELNAKLYSNRATAHFCVGNYTDTLSNAKAAIELRPTFIKAIVKGASACMELNLFEEALTWCAKGLSIDENNKKLLELKSRLVDERNGDQETQIKREATSYRDLGRMYDDEGQYFKAIECFQKSLELCQAIGDRKEERRNCNHLGAMYGKLGEFHKSVEWLEEELAICKQIGDREAECTCYNNLGGTYYFKGQFENAIRYVEKGLEIAKETGNIEGQKTSFSNLATILINIHQYERGIECCRRALEIMKESGDKQGEAKSYRHLGKAYHALGQHKKSTKALERAIEIYSTIGNKEQESSSCHYLAETDKAIGKCTVDFEKTANVRKVNRQSKEEGCCYVDLGIVYSVMGQYEKSIKYHEKALLIAKEIGFTDEIATCYNKLGSVYSALGQCEKSIEYHEKAFQLHKVAEDRKGEMTCVINIGTTHAQFKKYEKSIEFLEKGLEMSKAIGNKEGEAKAYTSLGGVYAALGQYEKSVKFLNKALDSTKKKEEREAIYANLGTAAQRQNEFDKAIKYLEQALEIMKERGVKGRPLAIVLFQLGINYALVPGHNFEKSRYYFLESVKNHEHAREGLKDEYKILLDVQNVKQYKYLSWISALMGEVDAALCIAERGRAHALEDLMCKKYAIQKRTDDSHEFKLDEFSLFTKQGCNCLFVVILTKKLYSFVTYPGTITVRGPKTVEERRSSPDISQGLLQDLVTKIFKSPHSRLQGECEDRSLSKLYVAESPAFEEQVDQTMGHLRGEDEDEQEERDLDDDLCLLYEIIIAPVADLLEGPEIVICPEGHMFRIPFAALKDANGKYLAEIFRLRLTPSLTTLKLIYDSPAGYHSQAGVLVVGDPTVGRVEFNGKVGKLPSLPAARSEVQMIARLLDVSPLVGEQATKQEVLTRIQEVSLVHIAAHGDAEKGDIAFAPNKSCHGIPKKEDFVLTMEDIAKVGIRAKLVVLSCCHSASGKVLKSEGVVGIARAFLGSGARSVLVSLWAINDAATKAFMNIFYKLLLREKKSASEALHLSMKKMRESPLYSDVIYWAPFVLIGDDVTLDL